MQPSAASQRDELKLSSGQCVAPQTGNLSLIPQQSTETPRTGPASSSFGQIFWHLSFCCSLNILKIIVGAAGLNYGRHDDDDALLINPDRNNEPFFKKCSRVVPRQPELVASL